MIAFDLASPSFGTSLLQRLQQFAAELSQRARKCCLLLSKRIGFSPALLGAGGAQEEPRGAAATAFLRVLKNSKRRFRRYPHHLADDAPNAPIRSHRAAKDGIGPSLSQLPVVARKTSFRFPLRGTGNSAATVKRRISRLEDRLAPIAGEQFVVSLYCNGCGTPNLRTQNDRKGCEPR
jgi:hypothetical protein